jgi:hypothetical protein
VDYLRLLDLARPYLMKNDLGVAHTLRVLEIARKHFDIPLELEDLVVCAIVLHDVGGCSIKEQYENGPKLAALILREFGGFDEEFIGQVCGIVGAHHDHFEDASVAFKILYDSDKLVMFSLEEFSVYDSRSGFDWDGVVGLFYSGLGRKLAIEMLRQRRGE